MPQHHYQKAERFLYVAICNYCFLHTMQSTLHRISKFFKTFCILQQTKSRYFKIWKLNLGILRKFRYFQETKSRYFKIFNFSNAVKNLKIPRFINTNPLTERLTDPTVKAILKYKNHPSIVAIGNANIDSHFHLNEVSVEEVYKEIIKLSPRKSAQSTDIPIRVRMENADIFAYYTWGFFNEFIKKSTFPSILKNENITRVFKKGYRSFKENYRPVSILPVTFKIFEKLLCKQITIFIDPLLSKFQIPMRVQKSFSAQHCFLAMLEKWKNAVDKEKVFGALLTDL